MDADARFDRCMVAVLLQEGGFSDLPGDKGGPTKFGISTPVLTEWRGHPVSRQDVWNLTKAESLSIYRAKYWNKVLGDLLPAGIDLAVLDPAVNEGQGIAARFLQEAMNVTPDGLVGPRTVAAATRANPSDVIDRIAALRVARYRQSPQFPEYHTDWLRRVDEITATARGFVTEPEPPALAKAA